MIAFREPSEIGMKVRITTGSSRADDTEFSRLDAVKKFGLMGYE